MLASHNTKPEHYDYDNPSHSMSHDNTPPRRAGSGNDIQDAGVVRPNMINILPDDDLPRGYIPPQDDVMVEPLPALEDEVEEAKRTSKIKGLFGKKKKKDKEGKEEVVKESKPSAVGGKLKGMFRRKGAADRHADADLDPVELTSDSQVSDMEVPNPAYDSSNPNSPLSSPYEPPGSMAVGFAETKTAPKKNPLSSLLRKPQTAAGPVHAVDITNSQRLELKPEPPASPLRCSNVLNVLLVVGAILGIVFLALSSQSQTLAVIGPVFLGLSLFALVGKIFFTLFWEEDPLPRLKPYVHQFETMLGPNKPAAPAKQVVIARSSMYGQRYGLSDEEAGTAPYPVQDSPYPVQDSTYPVQDSPYPVQDSTYRVQDYEDQIDTRMRTNDDGGTKAPTFI